MRPIFDGCCWVIDLRTAGKIIGWIGAVIQMFGLIFLFFVAKSAIESHRQYEYLFYERKEDSAAGLALMYVTLIILIILPVINLATNILLIKGSSNRRACYILPYLILDMIAIVFMVVEVVKVIPYTIIPHPSSLVLYVALKIYLWIVVFSLYLSLKNQTHHTQEVVYSQPPQQFELQQPFVQQQSVPQIFVQQQSVPKQFIQQQHV